MMRVVLATVVALSLAMAAGCGNGPQRQAGTAAPAGTPAPAVSEPALPAASESTAVADTTGAPTGSSTGGSTGAAAPGRCQAGQLTGDIEQFERPGQAGASQSARVRLTNTGARCTMSGYIGLQLLAADGQPRETSIVRTGGAPERLTLDRGQTAWALLDWMFTPNADEENTEPLCGPKPAAALVTPPGATGTIRITEDFGTVCRHGQVYTSPVTATRPT
jgi:hypothetical protein